MIIWLSATVLVLIIIQFYWSRRHLYAAAAKMKGPKGLPILGNALAFFCRSEDILDRIKFIFEYIDNEPSRVWLGPYLLISLKNPVLLEKIMSSQKFAYKHELYVFLEKFAGDGLISASGLKPNYKVHRRIIQPMFDLKFVTKAMPIIHGHINICMKKFSELVHKDFFDVEKIIGLCSIDIIADIVMGKKANLQQKGNTGFCKVKELLNIGFTRMVKVWLHPDFIYNWHPLKREQDDSLASVKGFIKEAIGDSKVRRKLDKSDDEFVPVVDTFCKFSDENPDIFTEEDLVNHLVTLLSASEDTFSIISSFTLLCFGMYPDYQNKAYEEIKTVIGEENRELSVEDIYKLTYLDMCIKDVMRLFPIAPVILRRTIEDYQLDKWVIPKGAAIAVPIFFLHRDPEFWDNPEHFHPDHFLPDVAQKRHPYAFMPFSAGPRGCIGKTLANMEIKMFLVNFLQRFEVEAEGKVPDIKLKTDISVRAKDGYNCRLKLRKIQ
ncbi:unnamed protein product [Phyllotreta striolata]|uniref:Cytochrome P450 monooxygenase n=1 Tax=Phyllotreta striolata TaxID=444603 RepID=A0A9N9XQU3_PHYSR|nr:unnamed protein product [Phyllotreta striolata]